MASHHLEPHSEVKIMVSLLDDNLVKKGWRVNELIMWE